MTDFFHSFTSGTAAPEKNDQLQLLGKPCHPMSEAKIRAFVLKHGGPVALKERKERKILLSPWGSAYIFDADPFAHATFRCISLMLIEEEDLERMNIYDKFGMASNDRMVPLYTIADDGKESEKVFLFAKVRNGECFTKLQVIHARVVELLFHPPGLSLKDKKADCDLLTESFKAKGADCTTYRACYAQMVEDFPSRIYKMYKLQTREEIIGKGKMTMRDSYKALYPNNDDATSK